MPLGEPRCPGCGAEIVSGVAHSCNRLVCPDCAGMRREMESLYILLDQAISTIHLFRNHKATSLEACDDVACQKVVKALGRAGPLVRCACGREPAAGHADTCTYF